MKGLVLSEKCKYTAKFVKVAQLAFAKVHVFVIKSDFILNSISCIIIVAFHSLFLVISVPLLFLCFEVRKQRNGHGI